MCEGKTSMAKSPKQNSFLPMMVQQKKKLVENEIQKIVSLPIKE